MTKLLSRQSKQDDKVDLMNEKDTQTEPSKDENVSIHKKYDLLKIPHIDEKDNVPIDVQDIDDKKGLKDQLFVVHNFVEDPEMGKVEATQKEVNEKEGREPNEKEALHIHNLIEDLGRGQDSTSDASPTSATSPPQVSQPGAFHMPGIDVPSEANVEAQEAIRQVQEHLEREQQDLENSLHDNTNEGLAVANLVDGSAELKLPQAMHHVPKDNKKKHTRLIVTLVGVGALTVLVVLALVLGICLSNKKTTFALDDVQLDVDWANGNTMAPTSASKEDHLLSILPDSIVQSYHQYTPVFQWMRQDPHTYSDERLLQRFAMASLYYATKGEYWLRNQDWLSYDVHECKWAQKKQHGLYEIPETMTGELYKDYDNKTMCNQDGMMEHLWLWNNRLVGTLPQAFYLLTNLHSISFDRNMGLRGTLASELGHLTQLECLALYTTELTGSIPSTVGQLSNLSFFWAMANYLTGQIPTEFGNLHASLQYLLIDSNQLTGTLPSELGRLSQLEWFWGWNQNVGGTFPTTLGGLTSLTSFAWDGNAFSGLIPSEFGLMEKIDTLHLGETDLNGTIPSELFQVPKLKYFHFAATRITGTIPSELFQMTTLERLAFYNTHIAGSLPTTIGNLSHLQRLWMWHCESEGQGLHGTLPSELGLLVNMTTMAMDCQPALHGTLPSELGQLTRMNTFHISETGISGTIPLELGQVTVLERLDFNQTLLQGAIPESLCNTANDTTQTIKVDCALVDCPCDTCICV